MHKNNSSSFNMQPPKGFVIPTNDDTGKLLPDCCQWHRAIFDEAQTWFKEFPNCCEYHQIIAKQPEFNKEQYQGIADKIVKQLAYTQYHISEKINNTDWYKDITDYIEINVQSFGQIGIGVPLYLGHLKDVINNAKYINEQEKKGRLLANIDDYFIDNANIGFKKYRKTEQ